MTTTKEAREALEDEIRDYARDYADEPVLPQHRPGLPMEALDAYAAAVERETEARVRAEIAERVGYTLADMRRKYHHLINVARSTADASHVVAWVSAWIRGVEQINGGDE